MLISNNHRDSSFIITTATNNGTSCLLNVNLENSSQFFLLSKLAIIFESRILYSNLPLLMLFKGR